MAGLLVAAITLAASLELYPAPQSAYMHGRRTFEVETILPIVMYDGVQTEDLAFLEPIYNALGYEPTLRTVANFRVGDTAMYIGTSDQDALFEHRSLRRYVPDPETAPPESYYLTINRNGIILAGADRDGMMRGIHTLAQIIRASRQAGMGRRGIPAVPHVEIRDHPTMSLRAALLRGPISATGIQAFAALKCNMLIFESDDFYALEGERLTRWRRIFDETRAAGMTPAPLFRILHVPDTVVRQIPSAVEGRSRIERITLFDDDWAAFSRRNLIVTPENPVRVVVNDQPMQLRQDYALSEGALEPPFTDPHTRPWMIRRVPGGAIPHAATAVITYSYAPPHTTVLCPSAPETRAWAQRALRTLIETLHPTVIHGGFGEIGRLNQDLRCRNKDKSHAEVFASAVSLFYETVTHIDDTIQTMIWADGLLPLPDTSYGHEETSLQQALALLPDDMVLVPRFETARYHTGGHGAASIQWMANRAMPLTAAVAADAPAAAHRLMRQIKNQSAADEMSPMRGVVLKDADPLAAPTRAILGNAWAPAPQPMPWPDGLNDFFDSALWEPTFSEVKETQVQFLESRVLSGERPDALREAFGRYLRDKRDTLDQNHPAVETAAALFDVLTRYLELEYEYAQGNTQNALRDLARLAPRYAEADMDVDAERIERIVDTIQTQQLFAPAPILIGRPLAYYRPHSLPTGTRAYHAPAQINYVDEKGVAQATLDLLAPCGGIFRIDFETVNATRIALYASDDGVRFEPVPVYRNIETPETRRRSAASITSLRRPQEALTDGPMRGPLFPATPITTRYIRLQVESPQEQAVLREVRAFASKGPARVSAPLLEDTDSPLVEWPPGQNAVGFLNLDDGRLAIAPTEIQLARSRDHLFIGVAAQDPMPHAMGATMKMDDAPLWEEESIEVRIRPGNRPARRLLVNPLGARHDGMAVAGNMTQWDAGWDADWRVEAETTATGWSATMMVPFAILGGAPEPGDRWHINFIRHRNNVERETSMWAVAPDNTKLQYGVLVFE